jgi:ABC-type multidrug transport system fused ATPase/permease subunit
MPAFIVNDSHYVLRHSAPAFQPLGTHATSLAPGNGADDVSPPPGAAVNDPLMTPAAGPGHPPQSQLAAAWWQAVQQVERTLAAAGAGNHADLDRLERWVLSDDGSAARVALAALRRLQPLFQRSAEGRAWAYALHQARIAQSGIPAAVARDAIRLETFLQQRPHLALALQQPRLTRQAQNGAMPSAAAHAYTHAGAEEGLPASWDPLDGRRRTAAHFAASAVSPCYDEIAYRQATGRWRSHHATPEGDCSRHGVPGCGQSYGIAVAQQLAERPAIARVLAGQAAALLERYDLPAAGSRGDGPAWCNLNLAFTHDDQAPAPAAPPSQHIRIDPISEYLAMRAAAAAFALEFAARQRPIPPHTPTIVERNAQDLFETLGGLIQQHARPWQPPDPGCPLQRYLPAELASGYAEILGHMQTYTQKERASDKRRRIEVYADAALAGNIARWSAGVCDWLQLPAGGEARYEIQGVADLYFLAHADHLNELSLRADIEEMRSSDKLVLLHDAIKDLSDRYGISSTRAEALTKQVVTVDYNLRELFRTARDVAKLGDLKSQKARMLAILGGLVLQGSMKGVAPIAYKNVNDHGQFDLLSYYQYYAALMLSNLFSAQSSSSMEKALVGMESWLNYQLLYCVFYGEPPKDDFNNLYNTLLRGREAGGKLLGEGLTRAMPSMVTLMAATSSMMYFDYRLGLLNILSLPFTFLWANRQNLRLQSLHQQGVAEIDRSARAVHSLVDAAADLRTLNGLPKGFESTQEQLKKERHLVRAKGVKEIWAGALTLLPMQLAGAGSVTVGKVLELGFGELLAVGIAATGMHTALQLLLDIVFNKAPTQVLDVKAMQAKLADLDSFDLPGGPIDQARRPVSTLPDLAVSFEGVHFAVPKRSGSAQEVLTQPQTRPLLNGVNLTVRPGEMVCLVGASGSGKTTLITLLAGVNQPSAGHVRIGGVPRQDIRKYGDDSILSTIHYATQHPKFFPSMTVLENLTFGLPETYDNEQDMARAHGIIEALLARLNFRPDFDLHAPYSTRLSGGEHARLGMIRAVLPIFMSGRGILIADEPTAALDGRSVEDGTPGCAEAVIALMQEVAAMGVPVICVSHDPRLVAVSRSVLMADINPTQLDVTLCA